MRKIGKIAAACAAAIMMTTALAGCARRPPKIYFYEQYPDPAASSARTPDIPDVPAVSGGESAASDPEPERLLELEIPEEYGPYFEMNNDLVGWLEIPGVISTPVVRSGDNETYLTKNFDGSESSYGRAAFADFRCRLEDPDNKAVMIYGHNLLSGEGFAPLIGYYPWRNNPAGSAAFAEAHPIVTYKDFYRPEQPDRYLVIAAACVTADPADPYYIDPAALLDPDGYESAFGGLMPEIFDRSAFYPSGGSGDISVSDKDSVLILSTCIGILGKEYETRFIVMAKRIDSENIPDVGYDLNESPLYFQAYYDMTGLSWPGRSWDPGLISE